MNTGCPLCSQEYPDPFYSFPHFSIERCRNCGAWITLPKPTSENAVECNYEDDYYEAWAVNEQGLGNLIKIKTATFNIVLKNLERFIRPGNLLDIGCAMGFSLAAAQIRGWSPYGVDISSYAGNIARRTFGDRIYIGDFLKINLPKDFFDAVTMYDLFEHISNYGDAISKVKETIKKGGMLVIVTPSTSSLSAKIYRGFWPHIKFEHKIYMNPCNISVFLNKHGFEVLKIKNTLKVLNLYYVFSQFKKYPLPLVTRTAKALERLIPQKIKLKTLCVPCGEMSVFAKRLK